jgi:recombinational DNA repair protein RecR
VAGAVRYISKYVSKTIGQKSATRMFFCDRETSQAWIKQRFYNEINDFREDFKTLERRILNDYVCRITFKSKRDQNLFFNSVVKILFNSDWSVPGLYIFPDNPPG